MSKTQSLSRSAKIFMGGGAALAVAGSLMAPIPSAIQNALGDAGNVAGIQQAYADESAATALNLGDNTLNSRAYYVGAIQQSRPGDSTSWYSNQLWVRGDTLYKCVNALYDSDRKPMIDADGDGTYETTLDKEWRINVLDPDLYKELVTDGKFDDPEQAYKTSRNHSGWAIVNPTSSNQKSWAHYDFYPHRASGTIIQTTPGNYNATTEFIVPVFTVNMDQATVDHAGSIQQEFSKLQQNANRTVADVKAFKDSYDAFVTNTDGSTNVPRVMLFANTKLPEQLATMEEETEQLEAQRQEAADRAAAEAVDAAASTLSDMNHPTQADVNNVFTLYRQLTETQKEYLTQDVQAIIDIAQGKIDAASPGSGSDSSTGGNPDSGGSSSGSSTGGASTIIVNPTSPSVTVNPSTPDVTVNQGDTNLSVNVQGVDDLAIALRMQTVLGQLAMNPTQSAIDGAEADWGRLTDTQKRLVSNYESTMSFACTAIAPKTVTPAKQTKKTKVKTVTVNAKTVNVKAVKAAVKKANTAKKTASVKTVTKVVIGKKAKKVSKSAFKPFKKVTNLTIKSKSLTNESVKGSLADSKVKTVKVNVSNNKVANKKYVAKYKEAFAKANSGKKVTVKAGK